MERVFLLLPLLALAMFFLNTIGSSQAAPVGSPSLQPGVNYSTAIMSLNTSFFQINALVFSGKMKELPPQSSVSSECPPLSAENLDLLLKVNSMKVDVRTDKDGCQWNWQCRYNATRFPPFYFEAVLTPASLGGQGCPLIVNATVRRTTECGLLYTTHFVPMYVESVEGGPSSWFLRPEKLAVGAKCFPKLS